MAKATRSSASSSAPMSPSSSTEHMIVSKAESSVATVVESAKDAKSDDEEEEEEEEEEEPHPSIRAGQALIDSYTFHSVDPLPPSAPCSSIDLKGKRKADVLDEDEAVVKVVPIPEGEWMIGVDEAGRGPVLGLLLSVVLGHSRSMELMWRAGGVGPQVYGIAFCQVKYSDELKELGFAGRCSIALF